MRTLLILIAACALPLAAVAQPFQWTTFTSTSNVVDLLAVDGRVWVATSGGLAGYDPVTGTFDIYTNTRGLAMNNVMVVGRDTRGFVWAGLADGRITRINTQTGETRQVTDLQGEIFEITDILSVGDNVFVSANNGVYRFTYQPIVQNYRVLESIKKLGSLRGETRVAALGAAHGCLYAATAEGLARVRLEHAQLSSPSLWDVFTTGNSSLPENNIRKLQGPASPDDSGALHAVTPSFIVTLDAYDGTWRSFAVGNVRGFAPSNHAIAHTGTRVYNFDSSANLWQPYGDPLPDIMAVETDGSRVVVGLADGTQGNGGLVFAAGIWPVFESWDPPLRSVNIGGNFITGLGVEPSGKLWVGGSGFAGGVYTYDGIDWRNRTLSTGDTARFYRSIPQEFVFDDFGGAWVASRGRGLAWFYDDTLQFFNSYDSTGFARVDGTLRPRLPGLRTDPHFIETYLARNSSGDIYVVNLEAGNNLPLARIPREWIARRNNSDPWQYFAADLNGPADDYYAVGKALVDPLNRVWMGAGRNGTRAYVLDLRGTPDNPGDDQWFAYIPNNLRDNFTCFEDINKEVLDWDIDGQGYLWIGTLNGAYYAQGGVPFNLNQLRFICMIDLPIGNRVNAVHVDAQDNKWFGTDQGVAVLDRNFNWIHVFQTATSLDNPSDLTANFVTAIASNAASGEVWIGTTDGLSRFNSPYVSSGGDFGDVWPYPNPFRTDGSQRLRIDPQRLGGRFDDFRVYTISGRLVRKLTWAEMTDPRRTGGWDGRNADGVWVAAGVYLLVATSNNGKTATGKVAVLGR